MLSKKFILMGDATPTVTKDSLELFKNVGFDTFLLYPSEANYLNALKMCDDAGVNVFIFGGSPLPGKSEFFPNAIGSFPNYFQRFDDEKVDLNQHSVVTGNYYIDEPGADLYGMIRDKYVDWHNKKYSKSKIWHSNLFPSYANDQQLAIAATDTKTIYENYVHTYVDEVLLKVKGVKTIGVDHYPLRNTNGVFLSDEWLSDLMVVGLEAKRANCIYSVCIQAFGMEGLRFASTPEDIRLQVYTALAFGARMLEFYAYSGSSTSEYMVIDGKHTTNTYFASKDVISEIRRFEEVFLSYSWVGLSTFSEGTEKCKGFELIAKNELKNLKQIDNVTTDAQIIVSELENEKGENAYVIVNYGEPTLRKFNLMSFVLKKAKKVDLYKRGFKQTVIADNNGKIVLLLEPGEGVFIVTSNN